MTIINNKYKLLSALRQNPIHHMIFHYFVMKVTSVTVQYII